MLLLNSHTPQSSVIIHVPDYAVTRGQVYPLVLRNVATEQVHKAYTEWTAEVVNNRYVQADFNTANLATGMYIAEFYTLLYNPITPWVVALCYASPGGTTAIPVSNYDPNDSENIYIYYGE